MYLSSISNTSSTCDDVWKLVALIHVTWQKSLSHIPLTTSGGWKVLAARIFKEDAHCTLPLVGMLHNLVV